MCGQNFLLGEIEQGKSKTIQYKVRSDSQYTLVMGFHSGRKLEKERGAVTNGLDFEDIVTLNDQDALFTR